MIAAADPEYEGQGWADRLAKYRKQAIPGERRRRRDCGQPLSDGWPAFDAAAGDDAELWP
jgi:hypothetical protein